MIIGDATLPRTLWKVELSHNIVNQGDPVVPAVPSHFDNNMGKVLPSLSDKEVAFIASQKVFFVATSAVSVHHHVSVSPKANSSAGNAIVVLDPHTVAYADWTGSGSETAAHVLENGRMTLLFVNLESGPPKILRLFGMAHVWSAETVPADLLRHFPPAIATQNLGFRAVYKLHVDRISDSCGFSMPIMNFEKYRKTLDEYTTKAGKEGIAEYRILKNSFSIDGLPSLAHLHPRNASLKIEPMWQDGYFHGKVDPMPSLRSKLSLFLSKSRRRVFSTKVRLRACDVFVAAIAIFVLGIFVGCSRSVFSVELFRIEL